MMEQFLADRAEQEAGRKGCQYCGKPFQVVRNGKDGKEKTIIYIGKRLHAEYDGLHETGAPCYLHHMNARGKMDLFEINNCFMCGRELEADNEG